MVLVVNRFAGRGRATDAGRAARAQLHALGAQVQVVDAVTPAETERLLRAALADAGGGADAVVVVGGDGTLSALLDVLTAAAVPVVLVPAGTGNDFARALGLPRRDPAEVVAAALDGIDRRVDVGLVQSPTGRRLFLTVVALGFDARVSDRTNRLRYPRGVLRYYLALVIELIRLEPTPFRIRIDGGDERSMPGTLLAVGNTASYGGGMPICIGAAPDDRALDVVHAPPLSRLRLLRLFPLLLRGTHLRRAEVSHWRAETVDVAAVGLIAYADGERVAENECRISLHDRMLLMRVPRD